MKKNLVYRLLALVLALMMLCSARAEQYGPDRYHDRANPRSRDRNDNGLGRNYGTDSGYDRWDPAPCTG